MAVGWGVGQGWGDLGGWWGAELLGSCAVAAPLSRLPLQAGVVAPGMPGQTGAH